MGFTTPNTVARILIPHHGYRPAHTQTPAWLLHHHRVHCTCSITITIDTHGGCDNNKLVERIATEIYRCHRFGGQVRWCCCCSCSPTTIRCRCHCCNIIHVDIGRPSTSLVLLRRFLRLHNLIRDQVLRVRLFSAIHYVFGEMQSTRRWTPNHGMMARWSVRHFHRTEL